jgi:thiol-disulfide isomerase/thioredoxin
MTVIRDVTSAELEEGIARSRDDGSYVLVDFWAPWCGPCRDLHKSLKTFAPRFKDGIDVVRLDVQDQPESADARGIRGIPVLMLHKGGEQVARHNGSMSPGDLADWLTRHGVEIAAEVKEEKRASSYPEGDVRRLGAFYGDKDLRGLLLDRLIRLARAGGVKSGRIPYYLESNGAVTATTSAALVGNERADVFTRLSNIPIGVGALMEFCELTQAEPIEEVLGAIKAGAELSLVPIQFVRAWLADEYIDWADMLQHEAADQLRRDWLAAADQALAGVEPMAAWEDIRARAKALASGEVEAMVVNHFVKLLAYCCTTDVDSGSWADAMVGYGIVLNYVEAGRRLGMNDRQLSWNDFRARFARKLMEEGLQHDAIYARFVEAHGDENAAIEELEAAQRKGVAEISVKHRQILKMVLANADKLY